MKRNPVRKEQVTAILAVVLFYGVLQLVGITCPIKFITGISCPGCGMTRAWLSLLLRGDLEAAFHYHPLFWILIPGVPLFLCRHRFSEMTRKMCRHRFSGRVRKIAGYALILLFFAVYAVRMASPGNTIVVFRPGDGLIGRILAAAGECLQSFQRGR